MLVNCHLMDRCRARLTRTSIEANGSMCRGMLGHRYNDTAGLGQQPQAEEDQ